LTLPAVGPQFQPYKKSVSMQRPKQKKVHTMLHTGLEGIEEQLQDKNKLIKRNAIPSMIQTTAMFSQGIGQPIHVDTRPRFLGGQY